VLASSLAWSACRLVTYYPIGVMCATGLGFPIHLTTLVTIAMAGASGLVAYRTLRRPDLTDGTRFAALGGALLSVMFGLAIVMESLPSFGLGPCANG
jgi:hypothetical protein